MKTMPIKIITSVSLISLLIASCGKTGGSGSGSGGGGSPGEIANRTNLATDGSNIQGYYQAKFITLNPHVNGTIPGSATFYRKEEKLMAYLRLFAGGPKAWHQQKIYNGKRCPNMSDDKNNDGFIDIVEAEAVLGKVIIPLDADLSNQYSGRNFYPVGDLSGSYHYERVVSFSRFFSDLKAADKVPEDNIVKLAADEPLVLEGKVVMIQGTAETIEYPETVQSSERHKPFQTLPIACGIFAKADFTPGSAYSEDIPGPIADVVEGQDRPSEGEESTGTGGGTTTSGGNNDSDRGEDETEDENGHTRRGGDDDHSSGGSSGGTTSGTSGGTSGGSSGGFVGGISGGFVGGIAGGRSGESSGGSTGGSTSGHSGGN